MSPPAAPMRGGPMNAMDLLSPQRAPALILSHTPLLLAPQPVGCHPHGAGGFLGASTFSQSSACMSSISAPRESTATPAFSHLPLANGLTTNLMAQSKDENFNSSSGIDRLPTGRFSPNAQPLVAANEVLGLLSYSHEIRRSAGERFFGTSAPISLKVGTTGHALLNPSHKNGRKRTFDELNYLVNELRSSEQQRQAIETKLRQFVGSSNKLVRQKPTL